MAFDTFAHRFTAGSADLSSMWESLTDVDRLTGWIDILGDVETIEPLSRYAATLEDTVGPFSLRADLDIRVTEMVEGRSIRFRAEGEDRQVGSRLVVDAGMGLEEGAGGILVEFSGSYSVEGRIATMGGPLIKHKATTLLKDFVAKLETDFR